MGTASNQKVARLKFLILTFSFLSLMAGNVAWSSPENDRIYALDTLGWLRAADNVDGIFGSYMDDIFQKYFSEQSRFDVRSLNSADSILSDSKVPYPIIIQDNEVLRRLAQKFKVESLLRTRVFREGETYRFQFEWVYAPRGDVLATQEFRYVDAGGDQGLKSDELPNLIRKNLDELIAKLPFFGQVTGVDNDTVTVNIGRNQGVTAHQILGIYTLQALKRHPLYKTIEEWRWMPVGKVRVEQVEESMLFGKIIEMEPNQHVMRYQKVRDILAAPPEDKPKEAPTPETNNPDNPRLGWAAANFGLGSYSRNVGPGSGLDGRGGGGFAWDGDVDAMIWFNSQIMAQGDFMGGLIGYTPTNLQTGKTQVTQYSGTQTEFRLAAGYAFFPIHTIMDATAWADLGYKNTMWDLVSSTADFTGPSSVGSFFLGIGGQVPVWRKISLSLSMDIGLFNAFGQTAPSFGTAKSVSDLAFDLAAIYQFDTHIYARLLFRIEAEGATFSAGQTVSQTLISVCPSFMYTF